MASLVDDALIGAILKTLPEGLKNVLEIGCGNGWVGDHYKRNNNTTSWVGVCVKQSEASGVGELLDRTLCMNLSAGNLHALFEGIFFDVVIIQDLLNLNTNYFKLFSELYDLTTPDGMVLCCVDNLAHHSVITKIISGISIFGYSSNGGELSSNSNKVVLTIPELFKLLLDAAWLPHSVRNFVEDQAESSFMEGVTHAVKTLGISPKMAFQRLNYTKKLIKSVKMPCFTLHQNDYRENISVVVPVNRQWEFENNIMCSPGLKEINAEILPVYNTASAAEAFAIGKAKAANDWIIFMHQDVYVPSGSGHKLLANLGKIKNKYPSPPVIGFIGIDMSQDLAFKYSGLVIDRNILYHFPTSDRASSVDEFAVILHKSSKVELDPQFGWHLWATDLCLQAFFDDSLPNAVIINVPLFHNSLNDGSLPDAYNVSRSLIARKFPQLSQIPTLFGLIE